MGKVKIIATIGPATEKPEVLRELVRYVDGVRINFSHGNANEWRTRVSTSENSGVMSPY